VAVPRRRLSWIWLLPLMAAIATTVLLVRIPLTHGTTVSIRFVVGNGLVPGDSLRHRGVQIGSVERVALEDEGASVLVEVRLDPSAEPLARSGSRFWVVRPVLSLAGATGLETVVGPRYLAIEPGNGPLVRSFVGLEAPPVLVGLEPGGLEVVLDAPARSGLRAGAPVSFRQMDVGRVKSVKLASDANAVEALCYIEPAYAGLVRKHTRFWAAGGIEVSAGLFNGLRIEVDSIQALLAGGVAFATPPEAGPEVAMCAHFPLFQRPEPEWLQWRPSLPVGLALVPSGAVLPRPVKVQLGWESGPRWISRDHVRSGWAVPVGDALLIPADLTVEPVDARSGTGVLRCVAGEVALDKLKAETLDKDLRRVHLPGKAPEGSVAAMRPPVANEDCLVVGDPDNRPRPLAGGAIGSDGAIDGSAGLDQNDHGAAVLARGDGALIGLISVSPGGHARLIPMPAPAAAR
jgi:hypothetical protein